MDPGYKWQNEDVDLGQLFFKTGGLLKKIFFKIIELSRQSLLFLFVFIKKNIVWLVIGAIAGMSYGFYSYHKKREEYSSTITLRTNFNSGRVLYSTTDLLNNLVKTSQSKELAKLFDISDKEASSLISFDSSPDESELILAEFYRDQFLNNQRDSRTRMDTLWARALTYNDFKARLSKSDHPVHNVKVVSTDKYIFPKLEKGIIDMVSSDKFIQNIKTINTAVNRDNIVMLTNSIRSLDSLKEKYNKKEPDSRDVTLLADKMDLKIPEIELYDKQLALIDELNAARKQEAVESEIVQVYNHFNTIGVKDDSGNRKIMNSTLLGLLLVIVALFIVQLLKYLTALEKKLAKPN